ncbi:PAS and helix-turn-helix domain-containing protein [Sphingopyxis sp.]|jgi:PAS domain S-box-containing protein|uniref:PAS and helix-turn-helix domain-containing protein n=1 Tax=Sphingopyxis sp. TaxID=1908224 RepID=UPI002DF01A71|nr:PAS and helix-turn-helix domain-containing protein [Sphingopyxis sp.]
MAPELDTSAIEGGLSALAFEQSPVATIYTEQRIIRRANAAFAEMFELPRGSIEGLSTELFYPSHDDSERVAGSAYRSLGKTGLHSDERTMQRQSGALFWCAVSGRSLSPDDPFAQCVWCFQDMSLHWNLSELRPRDREVAILICEGRTAKEVARLLDLSPRTVETYLARIKHKLAVRNVAELGMRLRPAAGVPNQEASL